MAPILHCIRHGQGLHNVGGGNYTLQDPSLTPFGEEQSLTLRGTSFAKQSNISLVVASPLCRTVHTAFLIFGDAVQNSNLPSIMALPDVQETSDDACDIGSEPSRLKQIVSENNWPVDLSHVHDGWNSKDLSGRYSPRSDAIAARARCTRVLIRDKIREMARNGDKNAQVVLVTHGSFLHFFTEDWEDAGLFPSTGWRNCEMRSYVFESDYMEDRDSDARLIETSESRQKRGKDCPMYKKGKQQDLFEMAMQQWEDQGLQRPDRL